MDPKIALQRLPSIADEAWKATMGTKTDLDSQRLFDVLDAFWAGLCSQPPGFTAKRHLSEAQPFAGSFGLGPPNAAKFFPVSLTPLL